MTLIKIPLLKCDAPGCPQQFTPVMVPYLAPDPDFVQEAQHEGWFVLSVPAGATGQQTVAKDLHFCSLDHLKKGVEELEYHH